MSDNSQIDLKKLKAAVLKEFEIRAADFRKNNPSAVRARKAFVLIARKSGHNNPEIAQIVTSTGNAGKVSGIFGDANKLFTREDPNFVIEVERICKGLGITLDNQ